MRGHCFQAGAEFLKEYNIEDEANQISLQALELLNAEQCPSEVMDLVLAPDQMMLQIHESVGHPLELTLFGLGLVGICESSLMVLQNITWKESMFI